jgi:transposase-like protein
MTRKKKSDYVAAPLLTEKDRERLSTVMLVVAGELTVTEAATRLGLSRNRFQTIMHRALTGLIDGLRVQAPGRPAKPVEQTLLEEENHNLRRENERLKQQAESTERLLGIAGEMLKGRAGRARTSPAKPTEMSNEDDDEPDGALAKAEEARELGMNARIIACAVGCSTATLRRWRERKRRGLPLRRRRGPQPAAPPPPEGKTQVAQLVRALHGLPGAASLARSVPGISRRQAAAIKHETLTQMERERIERCGRVVVAAPDIIRGFDAMHLGDDYALVSADAHVPYRTSIEVVERYDGEHVAAAVERDFAENGAPLVWRADCASCHDTAPVLDVLSRHEVLLLHGPPHHPLYYGQLERQNREHRAWLDALAQRPEAVVARMRYALNELWRRRKLSWCTAGEAWRKRRKLCVDRGELRAAVQYRAGRIIAGGAAPRLASRLAIEQMLVERGLLSLQPGGRC